jgi:hypothetical protein
VVLGTNANRFVEVLPCDETGMVLRGLSCQTVGTASRIVTIAEAAVSQSAYSLRNTPSVKIRFRFLNLLNHWVYTSDSAFSQAFNRVTVMVPKHYRIFSYTGNRREAQPRTDEHAFAVQSNDEHSMPGTL